MASTSPPATGDQVQSLTGVVKTLTYVNPDNGYFVARVDVAGKEQTVTGTTPAINLGETLSAKGKWVSSNWGPQFKASEISLAAPNSLEGIEKYLAHAIEGIGKGFAKKLVAELGEAVFDVIENDPDRLRSIKGIGKKKADALITGYAEKKSLREIEVFLFNLGLSPARAKRVFNKFGFDAVEQLKVNPYLLCDEVWGIGFKTADEAARKQGIGHDSEFRITAAIHYLLREAEGQGSCGLPDDVLRERASELLGVDYARINNCVSFEVDAGKLVQDWAGGQPCTFREKVYGAEKSIAQLLLKHAARHPAHTVSEVDCAILDVELDMRITLEDAQREAVRAALLSQVCVITGGPGTGKTTITRVILECLKAAGLNPLLLCAPTGKAAKRASEATKFDALTVHRTLEVQKDGQFKFNEKNPLEADVLVVDESSMVDIYLFRSILKALPAHCRLLIIGDVDQLPSVGPGKVLADIIDSGAVPTVRLTQVFRQAATSQIIVNAHKVNRGEMPVVGYEHGSDFCFTNFSPRNPKSETDKEKAREDSEKELLRVVRDMYKLGYDPIREVQVLAPMRRGRLGVISLNTKLQALLNPHPSAQVEFNGVKWGVGDKVMQLRNNYDRGVFNGDIGYVLDVDLQGRLLTVSFDNLEVEYKFADLDELTLAYAFTIHKSQGSEFPVVIMPLDYSHYMMLRRNLVYTAITRAKKLFVGVGDKEALRKAVETAQNDERWTRLKEWLLQGVRAATGGHELATLE
ncbi:ATP-dependent RecD-like DNA helicase [compost metagenome]